MLEILSIDDDPIHHEMLEAFFASSGVARIVRAMDGQQAKNLLDAAPNRFGLLICDLNMPDIDGVELLRHLRETGCTAPLLIVSGAQRPVVTAARELAKVYGLNLAGTLTKPLSFPALSAIVAPWLAQQSPKTTRKLAGGAAASMR
jgi:DNA-binding response OmpR family regulator